MIQIRDYQRRMIDEARQAIGNGHRCLVIQSSTGSGKTVLASEMVRAAVDKKSTVHFTVHRRNLIKQTAQTFDGFGIGYSYIASGYEQGSAQTNICSIDTLKHRIDGITFPKLLFVDEAHMSGSDGWSFIINRYKAAGTIIIMLTATPWRLDGSGLGNHASYMICGPSMDWLINNNYLSDFEGYNPRILDLATVKNVGNDYSQSELSEMLEGNSVVVGDAVEYYRRHAMGKLCVAYAVSRKHSEFIASKFNEAGIPAAHIDGLTPDKERERIIRDYADRKILVLTNCELITTGFDLAAQVGKDICIEAVSLLRPTQSLSLYLQMVGRGLRYKKSPAIIFDHANNFYNHGMPNYNHQWTLDDRRQSRSRSEAGMAVSQCRDCGFSWAGSNRVCPKCGVIREVKEEKVNAIAGELGKVTRESAEEFERRRLEDKRELWNAKTLDELSELGRKRGYKNPTRWAMKIISARKAKRKK
jgi:DNA repair protein RadD